MIPPQERTNFSVINSCDFLHAYASVALLFALEGFPDNLRATTIDTLPPFPYPEKAFESIIYGNTIRFPYGKHLKGYVDNLNKLVTGTKFF